MGHALKDHLEAAFAEDVPRQAKTSGRWRMTLKGEKSGGGGGGSRPLLSTLRKILKKFQLDCAGAGEEGNVHTFCVWNESHLSKFGGHVGQKQV